MPTTSVRNITLMLPGSYGKEQISNDSVANLSLGISGAATIALSNVDHTLTTDNQGEAMRFVLILTGTLTANVNVIVPAESRVFVADNRTTGAFTVTVKTASGGGVAVDQSARTLVYCDGTDVYPVASGTGGGGGSGAPTDATYLVESAHALLTGERAVTDTPTVAWDFATTGQAKAQIPDGAITYTKLQDVASSRLLGRFTAGAGDAQEITVGTGLTLDASGVLQTTGGAAQPLDATLTALAGLATGADQLPYSTGTDTFAQTPLTAVARTLLDDASQAAMQSTLGLVPGTTVQAFDATLSALAGVTTGSDLLPFFTGTDLATTTALTPFARSLLDDLTAEAARATLGITEGGVTAEEVEDMVGAMATDSATVDFTYDDTANTLTASVKDASVTEAKLSLSDVTTQDASTTQHGLLRKLSGTATQYLDGSGAWSVPAGGGGSTQTLGASLARVATQSLANTATAALSFDTETLDQNTYWSSGQPTQVVLTQTGWFNISVTTRWTTTTQNGHVETALRLNGTTTIFTDREYSYSTTVAYHTIHYLAYCTAGDFLEVLLTNTLGAGTASLTGTLTIANASASPLPATFLGLPDTPDAYTGQGGNLVTVNSGATALDFTPLTAAGRALLDDADAAAQRTTLGLGTMATQDASAVAITGGTISLGGHASTGVLDIQSTLVSEFAQNYFGVRIWPRVPASTDNVVGARIEPTTFGSGSSFSSGGFYGVQVLPQPAGSATGIFTDISAGTGRWNIWANGNAPSYFAGNVGIKNASPTYDLDVTGTTTRLNSQVIIGPSSISGTNAQLTMKFDKNSVQGFSIQQLGSDTGGGQPIGFANVAGTIIGSITSTATAVAYNTSSDVRLKHAVQALSGALATLAALRPVAFRWNVDDSPGTGFLAHELQQHVPEAVSGLPDALNDDGSVKPQQVDHSRLTPLLTAALQELAAQVTALAARVSTLETPLGL